MNDSEKLAAQITEVGEKFNKSLAEMRTELEAAQKAGTDSAADVDEKLGKFTKDFADNAAELQKLAEAQTAMQKRLDAAEAQAEELKRSGTAPAADAKQRAAAMHLADMRDEVAGRKTVRFGDEAGDLPTAKEVELADIAFKRYAVGGKRELDTNMPAETLAVGSGIFNPSFGFAVPAAMTGRIISELYTAGSLRGLALGRTVGSASVKLMRFSGKTSVTVGGELQNWSTGDLPKGYSIEYPINDWQVGIELHRDVVEDADFNLVGFLTSEAAMAYSEVEAMHHVNGDGHNKPTGFLTLDKTDTAIGSVTKDETDFGKVIAVNTGNATGIGHGTASNAAFAFNPLISAVNSMHSRYRGNVTIVMNRLTLAEYFKLRDADGNYFQPANMRVAMDGGMQLMGMPVRVNDHMPDIGANMYPVAVADWNAAYELSDRRGVFMLTDPYSAKPNIQYNFNWRSGGRPADTRALRFLKCAA